MSEERAPQQAERRALAALLTELGPDAPTLCHGWTTSHLAAHLVVRERRPLASVGITSKRLASLHDNAVEKMRTTKSYDHIVEKVRTGPPFHWKPVDRLFNTQEYFVHHEDARRGGGDTTPRPADEIGWLEDILWHMTKRGAKLATRKIHGVGVVLARDGGDSVRARDGEDTVTIEGRPGEITLYLFGRRDAAQVTITGSDAALRALEASSLGI